MTGRILLHDIGMPPLWVCLGFLVFVLCLVNIVIRLLIRYRSAAGARYAGGYFLLVTVLSVLIHLTEDVTAQALALLFTMPLSLLLAGGRTTADLIPALVFSSLVNASVIFILFGVLRSASRKRDAFQ